VITKTQEGPDVVERLHALDITTGAEKFGGPVKIQATVPGQGTNSSNGLLSFDPRTAHQRAGLLFVNGVVYIAWGSFADTPPYHGWVMAYDGNTLQQLGAFATTPNGGNLDCSANSTISAATPSAQSAAMTVPSKPAAFHCTAEKP